MAVTLPPREPRLYALVLEVQDRAGNVAHARRLVLYDNSSRLLLNTRSALTVLSADPRSAHRWQTEPGEVCLGWQDRFYNDAFFHYDYLLPVLGDAARGVEGVYEQTTGVLPVQGTPSVRGVLQFQVSVLK